MKNQRFKNVFNGDKVTVTDLWESDSAQYVSYKKDVPLTVDVRRRDTFARPLHAFSKAFVQICLAALLMAPVMASATQKTGYLVATTGADGVTVQHIADMEHVQQIFRQQFPATCINIAAELRLSPYFEMNTHSRGFYVEIKRVTKNGKYRKISNKQFKNM